MITYDEHDGVTTFETPRVAIDSEGPAIVMTLRTARRGAYSLDLRLPQDRELLRNLRELLNDDDVARQLDLV